MATKLRHKTVSVGVIYDQDHGFLLFYNPKWKEYAFCMKKTGEDSGEVALVALDEDSPLRFPETTARPLDTIGAPGPSGSTGDDTYYEYHVYELDAGPVREGPVADPSAKFFQYQDLLDANDVSWSTKEIARAMMERQEVSLAVVTRRVGAARQYLLVYKPSYGYFFPSARRKKNEPAESLAEHAIKWDTSYDGTLRGNRQSELSDIHDSTRFGSTRREFLFHVCTVEPVAVDLTQADNPFETALNGLQQATLSAKQPLGTRGYWDWFTEEEMATFDEMSPTMKAVLPEVLACAGND